MRWRRADGQKTDSDKGPLWGVVKHTFEVNIY